jgi:hypothetical protein
MSSTRVLGVTLAVAATAALSAGCTGGAARLTARAPLTLPAADGFHSGVCRDAADDILALGQFSYDHAGAKRLSDADRADLTARSDRLVLLRDRLRGAADPVLADQMGGLLAAVGFVRIRTGRTYDPQLLRDMEAARVQVQKTCTQARP